MPLRTRSSRTLAASPRHHQPRDARRRRAAPAARHAHDVRARRDVCPPIRARRCVRAGVSRRNAHRRRAVQPRSRRRTRAARSRAGAGTRPVSAFSLADLEQLAAREAVTLRSLLEELRAAGLELVAEAPIDLLQSARRSIEEVNIGGLALARLTVHRLPRPTPHAALSSPWPTCSARSASSARSRRCRARSIPPCRRPGTTM